MTGPNLARGTLTLVAVAVAVAVAALSAALLLRQPATAEADAVDTACRLAGGLSGLVGKACNVVSKGSRVIKAGKELIGGHVGKALKALTGASGAAASVVGKGAFVVGLVAVTDWVLNGARLTLTVTEKLLNRTVRPNLTASWFSDRYWRMAGIGALLTLPFLFAGLVQCVLRADGADLARSVLGYLPLSLLLVGVAAPLTTLLLSATDGLSDAVATATGGAGHSLTRSLLLGGFLAGSTAKPFVGLVLGMLVVTAGVVLWLEMLVRDAAIYVVVLMLPLVFAGLVWPARRVWAVRSAELLVALVLSKFVVVSVLGLGSEALSASGGSLGGLMAGLVLLTLAAAAPWALMRLLPMTEVAAAAGSHLRTDSGRLTGGLQRRPEGSGSADQPPASADALGPLPGGSDENARAVLARLRTLPRGGHDQPAPTDETGGGRDPSGTATSGGPGAAAGAADGPAADLAPGPSERPEGGNGSTAPETEALHPRAPRDVPPEWSHLPAGVTEPLAPGAAPLAEELPGLFLGAGERYVVGDGSPAAAGGTRDGTDDPFGAGGKAGRDQDRRSEDSPLPPPQAPPEGAL